MVALFLSGIVLYLIGSWLEGHERRTQERRERQARSAATKKQTRWGWLLLPWMPRR